MRATQREIARLLAVARVGTPGLVPTFGLSAVGTDRSLKFRGVVTIGATPYDVAANNGKLKTFVDADAFIKFAAVACETSNGQYDVVVDTGALLASKVPSDVVKAAQTAVTRLTANKASQLAVVADIDADLALMVGWESGNMAQVAKKVETQAQKATVEIDIAAIDTEIARLEALIAG